MVLGKLLLQLQQLSNAWVFFSRADAVAVVWHSGVVSLVLILSP